MAPADLRKDAGRFDPPIALGVLVATRQLKPEQLDAFATVRELAQDGSVRPAYFSTDPASGEADVLGCPADGSRR